MSGHQVSKQALAKSLAVILVVSALILSSTTNLTSARYLPTRADDSDVEVLKDLLREVSYFQDMFLHLINKDKL